MKNARGGRRLRGAIVGYGFIGERGHAHAYARRDDVDIVAVVDICEARLRQAAIQLPNASVFSSVAALLSAGVPLDFVDVCTPPCDHAAIAHQAMARGLHVLCEKPLTTGVAEAASLLEQAARAGRVLFPCHNYRHAPVVAAIHDVITSGLIGPVRAVTLSTFRNTHAKGVPEWNTDWRRDRRVSGGGIAMDHGSHTLYLTFDWMDSWPTELTAKMVNQEPDRWDTEDNFSAVLTFPGNRLANVHLTWTAGTRSVIYTVQGERGAVVAKDDDLEIATMRPPVRGESAHNGVAWDIERRSVSSHWMDASHTTWFNMMFDRFLAAIDCGDWVCRDTLDAYRCIDVIQTAYRSAAGGSRELRSGTAPPLVGLGGADACRTPSAAGVRASSGGPHGSVRVAAAPTR
jgi:predicted dehydrogenase